MAKKTNAMRMLDQENISYQTLAYDAADGKIDAISVAQKIGRDPKVVYKTLVARGASKKIGVFVIPAEAELDMKKAAKAIGEKKAEMLPAKDLQSYTGYIRGGCSPIGMKKTYETFIDESAADLDKIVVSAGTIGLQIELEPESIVNLTKATFADIQKR